MSRELIDYEHNILKEIHSECIGEDTGKVYHAVNMWVDAGAKFFKQEMQNTRNIEEAYAILDLLLRETIYTAYWTGVAAERKGFKPSVCVRCTEEVRKAIEEEEE